MSETPKFIKKAKETHNIHAVRSRDDSSWKLKDTAKFLGRSIGSICEDLLIAKWLKTHEKQLERFSYTYEALEFIREEQKKQDFSEIE